MRVLGFVSPGRNSVHVEIQGQGRRRGHGPVAQAKDAKPIHPRLLPGFPERDPQDVGVPVGVPPELQPALQLAMTRQEHALAIRRKNPRRGRNVAGQASALKTIVMGLDQGTDPLRTRLLAWMDRLVARQKFEQRPAMHFPSSLRTR